MLDNENVQIAKAQRSFKNGVKNFMFFMDPKTPQHLWSQRLIWLMNAKNEKRGKPTPELDKKCPTTIIVVKYVEKTPTLFLHNVNRKTKTY